MLIQSLKPEFLTNEYGVQLRRVYPTVETTVPIPFGSAWAIVEPGTSSTPHEHHEAETFYIVEGSGIMNIAGDKQAVQVGDVVLIPPFQTHWLDNPGSERLVFVSVWWEPEQGESGQ